MKKYKNLYRIRKSKNLTLKMMAERLGITRQYFWDIEDGRRTLSYKMAYRISEILEMKPDEIFLEDYKRK